MSAKRELTVVIPVYNEEGAIGNVLRSWHDALSALKIDFAIHAYNDGSRDKSGEVLATMSKEFPRIVAHTHANAGHGPTILEGYLDNCDESEWLFQVDSDDEMRPDAFHNLWNIRQDYDFIIGKRYERQSSWSRRLITAWARLSVSCFYGPGVFDVNAPYRLMRSSAFAPCFRTIPRDTFAPNVIVAGFAAYRNMKTVELHVVHHSRYSGTVSIAKWRLVKAAIRSMGQTIRYRFASLPQAAAVADATGSANGK